MDLVELSRRLENLIRFGTVADVDHDRALCRVDTGALLTDWLPWRTQRAGDTRTWCPPTVGEQVVILSPSGEPAGGVVLYGLFSAAHDQPSASPDKHIVDYPDGTHIEYDHRTHELQVDCVGDIKLRAAGDIVIEAQGRLSLNSSDEDVQVRAKRDVKIHASDGKMELVSDQRLLLKSSEDHVVTKCLHGTKVL